MEKNETLFYTSDKSPGVGVNDDRYYDFNNLSGLLKSDDNYLINESITLIASNVSANNDNDNLDEYENFFILKVVLSVVYVIIFITGLLGNIVTCIVISKNRSMHTAVNYYLFSLAISDLLLLISGEILLSLIAVLFVQELWFCGKTLLRIILNCLDGEV